MFFSSKKKIAEVLCLVCGVFLASSCCIAQSNNKAQDLPEATLEEARKAIEKSLERNPPSDEAMAILNHPTVELSILLDFIFQHHNCYRAYQASKLNKKDLLDHDLSEKQRKKLDLIYSDEYRAELAKSLVFRATKWGIAQSVSKSAPGVLAKANELLKDDVGVDFVLAWLDQYKRFSIDKSCGRSPGEAVLHFWKQELLWKAMAKKYQLD